MSGNKPNPVDTEQPWNGMPNDFAANRSGYSSAPRRRRVLAPSPAVQNEHGGQATAATAELKNKNEHDEWIGAADAVPTNAVDRFNPAASRIAISDEQSGEGEYTRTPERQSLMGEEFPTLEDDKMSFPDANNNMTGLSLGLQLDVSSDESDEKDEYKAATIDNILPVDSPQLSPSIPSDEAMDAASEAGNNIVHPINEESDRKPEANLDEILAELDSLRKKVASQDEIVGAMRQENASLKEQLESQDERAEATRQENVSLKKQLESSREKISAREAEIASQDERVEAMHQENASLKKKLGSQDEIAEAMRQQNASLKKQLEPHTERISAREAEIAALKKTTVKANLSVGVATSTKTPAGQILQLNCPRKDNDEQKVISLEKSSSSPPVSSLAARKATAVRSVQPFVAIAKDLYFDLTEAMKVGPKPSPLSDTTYIFQIWARAVITFLATPIWTLASFFMYLSVQHEKNLWMQANALTRKQLLGQVSGATGDWTAGWIWDMVFIVGSVISLCRL